jgi:hypothetical protein
VDDGAAAADEPGGMKKMKKMENRKPEIRNEKPVNAELIMVFGLPVFNFRFSVSGLSFSSPMRRKGGPDV